MQDCISAGFTKEREVINTQTQGKQALSMWLHLRSGESFNDMAFLVLLTAASHVLPLPYLLLRTKHFVIKKRLLRKWLTQANSLQLLKKCSCDVKSPCTQGEMIMISLVKLPPSSIYLFQIISDECQSCRKGDRLKKDHQFKLRRGLSLGFVASVSQS